MPLDYNPKDAANCVPAGEYDAELVKVEDSVSKAGNPMQVWRFRIFADREIFVTEYVAIPMATFKIKQLARSLGKEADFKAGRFQADDYVGTGIKVELAIDQQEGYDDKNIISRYVVPQAGQTAGSSATPPRPVRQPVSSPIGNDQQFKDDDIPF